MYKSNDIEVTAEQWEKARDYWQKEANAQAEATGILAVILLDGTVVYRAWPKRESIFKGMAED